MPRFEIPNTNVEFQSHLQAPFSLGASNNSLNTVGSRIFPRRTSPTAIGDIRNIVSPNFVYSLGTVLVTDEIGTPLSGAGTVQVTSPMTISAAETINISPSFVIDSRTYSTITLQYNEIYGVTTFLYWENNSANIFSSSNPITLNLNQSALFNATQIRAVIMI